MNSFLLASNHWHILALIFFTILSFPTSLRSFPFKQYISRLISSCSGMYLPVLDRQIPKFLGKFFLHNQAEEYYQSTNDFVQPKNEKQD